MNSYQHSVLVVDDKEDNWALLSLELQLQGYNVGVAENGRQALSMLRAHPFDLVLLDIMMPEMDGYEVLEQLKGDPVLRYLPVIMISAIDDLDSVVKCIELGAEDHLLKPFNPVLLRARVTACLEKKRLLDLERAHLKQLEIEQERSERLLLNILPKPIADQLKREHNTIADSFMAVTVLFADIVDFTKLAALLLPTELVNQLNRIFSMMDRLAERHGLEKIKTIGDSYMVVGGVPTPRPDHAEGVADMALDIQKEITKFKRENGNSFLMRVGIHSGPVVAGVIGTKKFSYDLWGDTVNTASRMESHGLPGAIQVTEATYHLLKDKYTFDTRGPIQVKGKGDMVTYLLKGKKG